MVSREQVDQEIARRVVEMIDEAYREEEPYERKRGAIGASAAGSTCIARLGFHLRGFPDDPVPPRRKRLFRAGHEIEKWVVRDLRAAGLDVWDKDDLTGRQHRREWLGGHVVCYADGLIGLEIGGEKVTAILEVKSTNSAIFSKVKRHGVKLAHRQYFGQLLTEMALFKAAFALFVAYNKDTSDYYAELVPWDQDEWDDIHAHLQAALDGEMFRIAEHKTHFVCRTCPKTKVCWGEVELTPTCRFCTHAAPNSVGTWDCRLTGERAEEVCDKYEQVVPKGKVK